MAERKTLTITQVEEVKKVGDKQIPKLSFTVEGQEEKHSYFTFRTSLFDAIKKGQTITADIETEIRGEYTNHKVIQIYTDGQPVAVKRGGYQGKSPEELEQQARVMVLSYAKDLAVADKIAVEAITTKADEFITWLKKGIPAPPTITELAKPELKINMDWLKESLEELNWADVTQWLRSHYPEIKKASAKTIRELVENLTEEHQEDFVNQIQGRLDIQRDVLGEID
jgi:hypothetical protein